jgi:uncharacterized protein YbaR (Trm112 family)/SAM-dependent methyltransferase
MRSKLLQFLACPECTSAPLALDVFCQEGEEIATGVLTCSTCQRQYPIIGGIPRLLPDALIGTLLHYHPDFFARHHIPLRAQVRQDAIARTLTFYSFARPKLFVPELDHALLAYWQASLRMRIPEASQLAGQFGIDAGCGEGRYTYCLAEWGAEVIGMDLSEAVNQAYLRNRANPRAHIVQGSIYQPPFTRGSFDFVVSTGVLHHLPDPKSGFAALVPLLHSGGSMHIWVYGLRRMNLLYRLSHLTPLHHLASHLPPMVSYLLSIPIALVLHLLLFRPVRVLARAGLVTDHIPAQLYELADLPFRLHLAEVQDRIGVPLTHFLTEEELRGWFERTGFGDIVVVPTGGGRGWSARGRLLSSLS